MTTETRMQRYLRLRNENTYYGGFSMKVCPLCGSSAVIRNATGYYCQCCEHYTDIDEVTEHDRR